MRLSLKCSIFCLACGHTKTQIESYTLAGDLVNGEGLVLLDKV